MSVLQRVAMQTRGGDAPGMNAAVRAVARAGVHRDVEVLGVGQRYAGRVRGEFVELAPRGVSGVIRPGGVFLGATRLAREPARGLRCRTPARRASTM